jgi:hypothetical protein
VEKSLFGVEDLESFLVEYMEVLVRNLAY